MQFTSKEYKILKTKNYMKENNLFFFFNSVNRNSSDGIVIEQSFKKLNFNCYKIFNKTSKKLLNNSVLINSTELINSMTFFIKPVPKINELKKSTLSNSFEPLLFNMLAIKFNDKVYSKTQLKEIFSFNYTDIKLILLQFCTVNAKLMLENKKF